MSAKDSQRRQERIGINASVNVAQGRENPPQLRKVLTCLLVDFRIFGGTPEVVKLDKKVVFIKNRQCQRGVKQDRQVGSRAMRAIKGLAETLRTSA
jgi:hypothetical protein